MHGHPAVYRDVCARDEIVFHQRGQRRCHLLRPAFAMQGNAITGVVLHLFGGEVILEPGADNPRGNAIDPDVRIRQRPRQRPRELRNGTFATP